MLNIFYFILLLSSPVLSKDPLHKGAYTTAFTASGSYTDWIEQTDKEIGWYVFDINTETGYFVINNLNVGLHLQYYTMIGVNYSDNEYEQKWEMNCGPVVRYYLQYKSINPFIYGSLITDSSFMRSDIDFGIGSNYFITKHVSFESLLKYNYDFERQPYKAIWQKITLKIGLGIFLF